MCPMCLSSAAMLITGTVSGGGVTALAIKKLVGKFRRKVRLPARNEASAPKVHAATLRSPRKTAEFRSPNKT